MPIELDVTVTSDDVVVVSHDPCFLNLEICLGRDRPRPFCELSWKPELHKWDCGSLRHPAFPRQAPVPGARIPSLDEVLSLSELGAFDFNIEAKIFPDQPRLTPSPEEFAVLVFECIRRRGLEHRVIFQSFDFRILHAMKGLDPQIRLAALYEGAADSLIAIAERAGTEIVAPHLSLANLESVSAAQAAGIEVIVWTANVRGEWDAMIESRVDAIITDDPAAVLCYLKSRKLR